MRRLCPLVTFMAWTCPLPAESPPFCELYAVGHFGNWYEVAGQREMRDVLAEARHWGYTGYADWFDTLDCVDPFAGDRQYSLANALWDRKKAHFRTAQSLGLRTDLIITPNHVYRDQLKPAWLAQSGGRVFGQLICPSKPQARQVILGNHRRLFQDLADAGVRLNAIHAAPYDYGGCNCPDCQPWILTFARLSREIHEIAAGIHPGVELHFIGWWWSAQEHALFADWMNEHAPKLAASIALHIPYGQTAVPEVRLPEGCRRHAFVHIGYAELAQPRDVYGKTGPVIAADRLEQTVRTLRAQSVSGVVAYSEGIFDDINKALLAGLFSGKYPAGDQVLSAYAERYFAADADQARQWADWLKPWGRPFEIDAGAARASFDRLTGDPLGWRRRQWELKADMFVAHQAIGQGDTWTAERLAHAERFWAAHEKLHRGVYGIGPLRHVIAPAFTDLPWYKSWAAHQRTTASRPASDAQ